MTALPSLGLSLWAILVAQEGAGVGAEPASTPAAGAPAPSPVAAPAAGAGVPESPLPPPERRPVSPFRLGLTYTRIFRQDGDLTAGEPSTNAIGIDMVFPSTTYGRNRLGLAHQWESTAGYSARGFRLDLISVGYPITLTGGRDHLTLEPILTVLRGEVMFQNGGGRFLRLESGFGLELSATIRRWFFAIQPLAIDFRYWVYASRGQPRSQTGLGRIFPFKIAIGYEF
jgi:hypothetical protein